MYQGAPERRSRLPAHRPVQAMRLQHVPVLFNQFDGYQVGHLGTVC